MVGYQSHPRFHQEPQEPENFSRKVANDLLVFISNTFNLNPKWFHDDKAHIRF